MLNNILVEASFYLPTVMDIMMYGAILIYIIHLIKQGPLIFNRKDMAINEG